MANAKLYRNALIPILAIFALAPATSLFANKWQDAAAEWKIAAAPTPSRALKYRLLPAAMDRKPGNAATLYNRALVLLVDGGPKLMSRFKDEPIEDEDGQERYPITEWLEIPMDELPHDQVQSHLAPLESILREANLAGLRRECDWGTGKRSDGPLTVTSELSMLRSLGNVLAVKARGQIASGDFDEALSTLETGIALARHLGQGPSEFHVQTGINIANEMLDRVEEWIQQLGAPNLYWAIATTPQPFCDLRPSLAAERSMLTDMFPRLKDLERGPVNQDVVSQVDQDIFAWTFDFDSEGAERALIPTVRAKLADEARRWLVKDGMAKTVVDEMPQSQIVIVNWLRRYRASHDNMTKWIHFPYHQARPRLEAKYAKFRSSADYADAALTGGLLKKLDVEFDFPIVWSSATLIDRRFATLRVVEAVRDYAAKNNGQLPRSLQDEKLLPILPDPISGRSFAYRLTADTATIRAKDPAGKVPSITRVLKISAAMRDSQ